MEIYFDRKARKLLRYIKWHPKKTLGDLQAKFGDEANGMAIINLCKADYLVCIRPDGSYTDYKDGPPWSSNGKDTFWVSSKGRKLLEDQFDRLWQWSIPTLISVAALIISILK